MQQATEAATHNDNTMTFATNATIAKAIAANLYKLQQQHAAFKQNNKIHSKKNESCVTQANTVYAAKAKFLLTRNGHS